MVLTKRRNDYLCVWSQTHPAGARQRVRDHSFESIEGHMDSQLQVFPCHCDGDLKRDPAQYDVARSRKGPAPNAKVPGYRATVASAIGLVLVPLVAVAHRALHAIVCLELKDVPVGSRNLRSGCYRRSRDALNLWSIDDCATNSLVGNGSRLALPSRGRQPNTRFFSVFGRSYPKSTTTRPRHRARPDAVPVAHAAEYEWRSIYVDMSKKKGESYQYGIGGGRLRRCPGITAPGAPQSSPTSVARARSFSVSLFNWPQAARMSRPRGVRTGLA